MIKILLLTLISLNFITIKTAQRPDKVIFEGTTYKLHSTPLSQYFHKYPQRHPKNLEPNPKTIIRSSGNWRGYLATFEIVDSALFVKDITIQINNPAATMDNVDDMFMQKSVLDHCIPNSDSLKLSWYSGILVLPHGKLVNYVHMGFASTYEKYILLEIKNGILKKTIKLNSDSYDQFREKQFLAFKETEEFKQLMKLNRENEDPLSTEDYEHFLKIYIINYTSKFLVD